MSSSEQSGSEPEPRQDPQHHAGEVLARLARAGEGMSRSEHASLLASLARSLTGSAKGAGAAAVVTGRWLTDMLLDFAPRLPLRDVETLRRHHQDRSQDEIADALISNAARATAAVGALGGVAASAELALMRLPTLFSIPAQIAAETLAVAVIEVKLVGELQELHGVHVPGTPAQRGAAYVQAWSRRRGVDVLDPGALSSVVGEATKRHVRRRLLGRVGRNLSTLGPYLTGAVAGGMVNYRETRKLGSQVREDLSGGVESAGG